MQRYGDFFCYERFINYICTPYGHFIYRTDSSWQHGGHDNASYQNLERG